MSERQDAEARLAALLRSVRQSSWRWECQGRYEVDMPDVHRWQEGLPALETAEDRAWLQYIADLRSRSIPFRRVRMLTDPLTDYLRWMLQTTMTNVEAGEDIRWLPERKATELGLPSYDFYVLDDERVAIMNFDGRRELVGVDLEDDPGVVQRHQRWRDLVWPEATPHADYFDRDT